MFSLQWLIEEHWFTSVEYLSLAGFTHFIYLWHNYLYMYSSSWFTDWHWLFQLLVSLPTLSMCGTIYLQPNPGFFESFYGGTRRRAWPFCRLWNSLEWQCVWPIVRRGSLPEQVNVNYLECANYLAAKLMTAVWSSPWHPWERKGMFCWHCFQHILITAHFLKLLIRPLGIKTNNLVVLKWTRYMSPSPLPVAAGDILYEHSHKENSTYHRLSFIR